MAAPARLRCSHTTPSHAARLVAALGCRSLGARGAAAAIRSQRFAEVDRILEAAIADGAFPGAVVAVGHRGKLVHLAAFGRQTYAPDAPPIETDTLYDIASLTKVVATTTAAMILVDEGKLDLDAPVARYLPRFTGPGPRSA